MKNKYEYISTFIYTHFYSIHFINIKTHQPSSLDMILFHRHHMNLTGIHLYSTYSTFLPLNSHYILLCIHRTFSTEILSVHKEALNENQQDHPMQNL